MYSNNRDAYRQAFYLAWQKYLKQQPLMETEHQMVEIILLHPEYHSLLSDEKKAQQQEFSVEENPFLHMSLHIAIREQIRMNRPAGITQIHTALMNKYQEVVYVEHAMMTCLAQMLWHAQQSGETPSENLYLEKLKQL